MSYWVESEETRIIIIVVRKFYQQQILGLVSFKNLKHIIAACLPKFESFVPFAHRFENETMC
jgi:hypothetical protein